MKSLNSFADHAPKPEWILDFFATGDAFLQKHSLGPMQISVFKKFLTNASLLSKNGVTPFFELITRIGSKSEAAWGLIYINLAHDNAQIRWYIDNMEIDVPYARAALEDRLMAEDVSVKDAHSIMKAYKRLCDTPLGTVMHMGTTVGKPVDSLTRTKCSMRDDRVLLYGLYRYAEACADYYEFSLSRIMDTTIDSTGISPTKLFGYTEDEMIAMLGGLSAKHPELINVSFTHGLDKISLREDKTAEDVLALF